MWSEVNCSLGWGGRGGTILKKSTVLTSFAFFFISSQVLELMGVQEYVVGCICFVGVTPLTPSLLKVWTSHNTFGVTLTPVLLQCFLLPPTPSKFSSFTFWADHAIDELWTPRVGVKNFRTRNRKILTSSHHTHSFQGRKSLILSPISRSLPLNGKRGSVYWMSPRQSPASVPQDDRVKLST